MKNPGDARENILLSAEIAARKDAEAQLKEVRLQLESQIALNTELNRNLALCERAIEASPNAMLITNAVAPDFLIEYVNPAFETTTGYTAAEALGRNCRFLQGDDLDQPGVEEIRQALMEQREGNAILRNYRKDKTLFWNHLYVAPLRDANGVVTNFVASQYDVTAFKNHENKLSYLAHHDELTSLPNRAFLRHLVLQAIGSAKRHNGQIWVLFIDLDRFKIINDSLGHSGGDAILQIISDRLLNTSRESDIVARWGGDEFVVVMREQPSSTLALTALQQMMAAIVQPIPFRDQEFSLSCSMGVSRYPHDSDDVDTLLDCADIAAYHVKSNGGNDFSFHTGHMNEIAVNRLKTETDLRGAIERDEFILHYQAQVDLESGRAIGVEALIRWNHPERGLLYPCDFIGIAEETGSIVSIGAWVLRAACLQNREWQKAGLPRVRMAVNLSARQFAQHDLGNSIALILAEVGLPPGDLEIELTESLIMGDVEEAIGVLRDIKSLGVTISVDDFGTGYSSLSYLKRLPLDVLKIDRSFVSDLDTGGDDATAIVTSIITLAHALKLKVIAEGVETVRQLDYLRRTGCDQMQGYYFGRPIIAAEFAQLLRSGHHLETNSAFEKGQKSSTTRFQ